MGVGLVRLGHCFCVYAGTNQYVMCAERVIGRVPRWSILEELSPARLLGETNHLNNLVYVVRGYECPAVMMEIGRLREIAFRDAGGGTGRSMDVDEGDLAEDGYMQMIVWDPYARQIVGGYRFIISTDTHPHHLSTELYFAFSERFRTHFLPHTIELGRSFIQPRYQSGRGGIFALDNLWDGMGAVVSRCSDVRYLFGKVTIYADYPMEAKQLLYAFLYKFHGVDEPLVVARPEFAVKMDVERYKKLFNGGNYQENLRILQLELKARGESIPPLIKSYINLSPAMMVFDAVRNDDFGGVEELAILLAVGDIYPQKLERHFVQKQKVL